MKKLLFLIVSMCMLCSMIIHPFAFEIKVTEGGREYAAHQLIVGTNYLVDTSLYDGTEAKDFHGVSVKTIECLIMFHDPNEWFDKYGHMEYLIILDESVDELEAIEILSACEGIRHAGLNTVEYPADDTTAKIGDVNCNGKIDARDYLLLKRAYFGTYELECDDAVADINGNGKLDARDYLLIKRAYFGTYTLGAPEANLEEA